MSGSRRSSRPRRSLRQETSEGIAECAAKPGALGDAEAVSSGSDRKGPGGRVSDAADDNGGIAAGRILEAPRGNGSQAAGDVVTAAADHRVGFACEVGAAAADGGSRAARLVVRAAIHG